MDEKTPHNINNYCRTCLQQWDLTDHAIKSIKKHDIFPDFAEKLAAFTGLEVEQSDEFPKHLCDTCFQEITRCHSFRTMCIESIQRFREMLLMCHASLDRTIDLKATRFSADTTLHPKLILEEEMYDVLPTISDIKENPLKIERKRPRKEAKKIQTKCTRKLLVTPIKISKTLPVKQVENTTGKQNTGNHTINECELKKNSCAKDFLISKSKSNKNKRTDVINDNDNGDSNSNTSTSFNCDICPARFQIEHRLIAHKRAHDGLVPYPCPREGCGRGFNRWHSFSEHLKKHDGTNRWFACEEIDCNKKYKHKATLDMHLRRFHKVGPELKSFVCEICGKVFKSSPILNNHRYTHRDKSELPFACDQPQCKLRFSNKAKLNVHLMRHAGIKKFQCPHCGLRKSTRNELKIHINYHTLERRWPCSFCSQICNSAGNLKVHIRTIHERAKDYACRYCERTFAKPDTRKYHEMIHTGEKPHQCAECGKRFVQPAALRTHKKVHLKQNVQCSSSSIQNLESVTNNEPHSQYK